MMNAAEPGSAREPEQVKSASTIRAVERHIRRRLISGLFVLVPLGITVLVLKLIFGVMAGFVEPFVRMLPWELSDTVVTAISLFIFIVLVYVVGLIMTNLLGRRIVAAFESVILRIPVVKSIYSTSKQIVDTIAPARKDSYKSVVLVEFPRAGIKSIGFVTGSIRDGAGREMNKVFVPTAPNPTTGFLLIVPSDQLEQTKMSVESAVKMIISGGVVSEDKL